MVLWKKKTPKKPPEAPPAHPPIHPATAQPAKRSNSVAHSQRVNSVAPVPAPRPGTPPTMQTLHPPPAPSTVGSSVSIFRPTQPIQPHVVDTKFAGAPKKSSAIPPPPSTPSSTSAIHGGHPGTNFHSFSSQPRSQSHPRVPPANQRPELRVNVRSSHPESTENLTPVVTSTIHPIAAPPPVAAPAPAPHGGPVRPRKRLKGRKLKKKSKKKLSSPHPIPARSSVTSFHPPSPEVDSHSASVGKSHAYSHAHSQGHGHPPGEAGVDPVPELDDVVTKFWLEFTRKKTGLFTKINYEYDVFHGRKKGWAEKKMVLTVHRSRFKEEGQGIRQIDKPKYFDVRTIATPERDVFSIEYKVTKWCKPGIHINILMNKRTVASINSEARDLVVKRPSGLEVMRCKNFPVLGFCGPSNRGHFICDVVVTEGGVGSIGQLGRNDLTLDNTAVGVPGGFFFIINPKSLEGPLRKRIQNIHKVYILAILAVFIGSSGSCVNRQPRSKVSQGSW